MDALIDDIRLFIAKADVVGLDKFLKVYATKLNEVLFQNEKFVIDLTDSLRKAIGQFAQLNSPFYHRPRRFVTKANFQIKKWRIKGVESITAHTGGSTTGRRFAYCRWPPIYDSIERLHHYKMIIEEFGISDEANILYLMHDRYFDHDGDKLTQIISTDDIIVSHGLLKKAIVHEVAINKQYWTDNPKYWESIIRYASDNEIDVILAPSNAISSLAYNVKRLKWDKPLCKLLSNTGEKLDKADIDILSNGFISNWCDHMRCWDGGAMFFTCKYNTYHLCDGVAYMRSDHKYRLISDDFFSLSTPFINYWNGDYAEIINEYQRCRCGRLFRPFTMGRTRSFAMNYISNESLREGIEESGLNKVKRINSFGDRMLVFVSEPLTNVERQAFRKLTPQFTTFFTTENIHG